MRYVNEILDGRTIDEFITVSSRDQISELRASASIGMTKEKQIRDTDGDTPRRRKYIAFLSATIQECDKALRELNATEKKINRDFDALRDEYSLFKNATLAVVGNKVYSKILEIARNKNETNPHQ